MEVPPKIALEYLDVSYYGLKQLRKLNMIVGVKRGHIFHYKVESLVKYKKNREHREKDKNSFYWHLIDEEEGRQSLEPSTGL